MEKDAVVQQSSSDEPGSVVATVLDIDFICILLESLIMSLTEPSTPKCNTGQKFVHLKLGQACLNVNNADVEINLQLWAQAAECYKCSPWHYFTLAPNTSQGLIVNSTYPTDMYIRNESGSDLHRLTYHFGEYGSYQLGISSMDVSSMHVLDKPQNIYLPLIMAVVFFFMLNFMWQCAKFLGYGMETSCTSNSTASPSADEHSHLLSAQSGSEEGQSSSQSQASSSSALLVGSQSQCTIPDSSRKKGRLMSLDTFRGIAIVIMIFVNYGGGKYYFFQHSRWNGLTVADLVFPWFLWIMGVSLIFSIRSQLQRTTKRSQMVLKITKRCIILFFLGLIINSLNGKNYMPTFRILGVLQRFSICYFITALLEVYFMNPQESQEYVWYWKMRDIVRSSVQWVVTIVLVVIHTVITFSLPVPGCPTGYLGPGGLYNGGQHGNCTGGAAGYIDIKIFGRSHVYPHPSCAVIYNSDMPYDPEGFMGAFTSVLMVQLGAAAGRIIITYGNHKSRIKRWNIWGLVCGLMAGFLCGWRKEGGLIPVNKNLWSLSFVFTTACFAFFLLSLCYLLIDKWHWWSGNPFRYAGMNSILLYVGHELSERLFPWSWQPVGQYHSNHLIMNLWGTSIWVIIAYLCHRNKFYVSL